MSCLASRRPPRALCRHKVVTRVNARHFVAGFLVTLVPKLLQSMVRSYGGASAPGGNARKFFAVPPRECQMVLMWNSWLLTRCLACGGVSVVQRARLRSSLRERCRCALQCRALCRSSHFLLQRLGRRCRQCLRLRTSLWPGACCQRNLPALRRRFQRQPPLSQVQVRVQLA